MPGSILPLPVMLEEEDRKVYENLEPPKSIVVRYGAMRYIAELPFDGSAKPGCGSKLVVRSPRGIELATMLTSTCPNAGCGNAVTRKQMLQYIDNSGGKDYPFTNQGKVLRVATVDDLNEQARLDANKPQMLKFARLLAVELDLPMKIVDVELLLGGERVIFHYTSEQWVDFRELVRRLAHEYQTRIEMHQVNARDEARLVADYEKCGQHCCCRQFLKVLKPVSMRNAKIQKATLDPTKISGRCGRLMCCLRYEEESYDSLRKRLPNRQSRVITEDGPGTVIDTQILTQLVLVALDHQAKTAAYPVEHIQVMTKEQQAAHPKPQPQERGGDGPRERGGRGGPGREQRERRDKREPRRPKPGAPLQEQEIESREGAPLDEPIDADVSDVSEADGTDAVQDVQGAAADQPVQGGGDAPPGAPAGGEGQRRRRRRRRRRRGGGNRPDGQGPSNPPSPGS